jgi:hypothetical protein
MLLADVTVPSLYKAAGLERGELRITYDPTLLQGALRIKAGQGAVYDADGAKGRVSDLIEQINDALPPFRVSFLKADVRRPEIEPWPLDLMTAVSGLQLFYLRAQACNELFREVLHVVVSLTMPKISGGKVRAQVDCYLPGDGDATAVQTAALQEYCAAVQAFWNRLAATVIGHWSLDNGISELRLTADILVDPRQAMAAIGQPLEEAAEGTVH